ncbi:hypothetical protein ACJ41O_011429 [Fusarium nematophilum]
MTTATQHQQHQPPQSHLGFVDTYDPDEVVPRGSPLMTPLRPKLEPSPSPPPDIPPAQVSLSPTSVDGRDKSNRHKVRPTSGDAVLVAILDNGRDPEIARLAGREGLPYDDESLDDESRQDRPADSNVMNAPSLRHLAADALQAALATPAHKSIPDISITTGRLSLHDEPSGTNAPAPAYPTGRRNTPPIIASSGALPPLQREHALGESKESLPSLRTRRSSRTSYGLSSLFPSQQSSKIHSSSD